MNRHPHSHMTEDEFIGFILDELPPDRENMLDQHLANCVTCARKLEDFYTAQEEFPETDWARQRDAFVANLRQQIFAPTVSPDSTTVGQHVVAPRQKGAPLPSTSPPQKLFAHLLRQAQESLQARFQQPVWAAKDSDEERRTVWEWRSPGGELKGHAVLARSGAVTFRFSSQHLELDKLHFVLRWGTLRREAVLRRVSETEVGAKIEIPRHQRPSNDTQNITLQLSDALVSDACVSDACEERR